MTRLLDVVFAGSPGSTPGQQKTGDGNVGERRANGQQNQPLRNAAESQRRPRAEFLARKKSNTSEQKALEGKKCRRRPLRNYHPEQRVKQGSVLRSCLATDSSGTHYRRSPDRPPCFSGNFPRLSTVGLSEQYGVRSTVFKNVHRTYIYSPGEIEKLEQHNAALVDLTTSTAPPNREDCVPTASALAAAQLNSALSRRKHR